VRAAIFSEHGGPEVIRIEDVERPRPGPGEVLVRVSASSLNHLDLWARRGLPFEIPMPHIGGSDIVGVVEEVGPGSLAVPEGTRVVVDPSLNWEWYEGLRRGQGWGGDPFGVIGEHTQGGFAEYVTVPAANLLELPEGFPFETAAAAGLVFATAWSALITRGGLRPGERVIITGASGGVGTAAVQLATRMGAGVLAVTSGAGNAERLLGLGVHQVLDRTDGDFAAMLKEATRRDPVDLVLDSVGATFWPSLVRSLRPGGRLVCIGATAGPTAEVDLRHLFWKRLSLLGSTMSSPGDFVAAMRLVFRGEVGPVVDRILRLESLAEGHQALEAGEVFGKIVIRV